MSNVRCYTASWVLPVTAPPIRDGALLVDADGRIAGVGPLESMPSEEQAQRIELGDAALLPGLINVHAHPELSAFRGLLDDLPFHEWIPSLMRCKRGAALSFEDYLDAARWTCIESLRNGVTTMGATEDSGAGIMALVEARMRGLVYLEVFGPAPDQVDSSMALLREKIQRFGPETNERVRIGVSPHAPYTVSDALYKAVAELARRAHLPVATHTAEAEVEELLVREGLGPFAAGLRRARRPRFGCWSRPGCSLASPCSFTRSALPMMTCNAPPTRAPASHIVRSPMHGWATASRAPLKCARPGCRWPLAPIR